MPDPDRNSLDATDSGLISRPWPWVASRENAWHAGRGRGARVEPPCAVQRRR